MSHLVPSHPRLGRILKVDSVHGNDQTGRRDDAPYKTVNAAISAATSGDTVWVMPGTYELTGPITVPAGVAIRGHNVQTTNLQMTNVIGATTLITVSDNTRIEDVNIKLTSAGHYDLTAIEYPGNTCVTSKLRTSVVTVDNSGAGAGTSTVACIKVTGTGSLGDGNFSFNAIRGSTLNVKSTGSGNKVGIWESAGGSISTRDTNVFSSGSSGTHIGILTTNTGSFAQIRSTSIYGSTYDIQQASGTIDIGPGVDLINKTADGNSFSTFVYPTTIFYGTVGSISASQDVTTPANYTLYLSPGSGVVQPLVNFTSPRTFTVYQYPDSSINYYSIQQKALAFGLLVSSSISPGTGNTTRVVVMKNGVDTALTASIVNGERSKRITDTAVTFAQYDALTLRCEVTGSTNTTHDLTCQIDMY